jgi:integration host factor subunit alpha
MNEETTTKADLADAVYDGVGGFSKRECSDLVDSFFEVIKDTLSTGEKVKLSGFGNFEVRYKKPRLGRNPLTGEEIMISARHVVTFKASPVLKDYVNDELGRPKFDNA